jgi:hypothetical protein
MRRYTKFNMITKSSKHSFGMRVHPIEGEEFPGKNERVYVSYCWDALFSFYGRLTCIIGLQGQSIPVWDISAI